MGGGREVGVGWEVGGGHWMGGGRWVLDGRWALGEKWVLGRMSSFSEVKITNLHLRFCCPKYKKMRITFILGQLGMVGIPTNIMTSDWEREKKRNADNISQLYG